MKKRFNDMTRLERVIVIKAITGDIDEIIARDDEDGRMDVRLTINGIETDFEQFARNIDAGLDDYIEEKAIELLKQRTFDGIGIKNEVEDTIDALIAKLNSAKEMLYAKREE